MKMVMGKNSDDDVFSPSCARPRRRHTHDSDTGLKSSRQRARVDGQVHLVAHIHGDSLEIGCAQLATRPSSSWERGWLFLRRRPLLVHSDAASTTCLTHMLGY